MLPEFSSLLQVCSAQRFRMLPAAIAAGTFPTVEQPKYWTLYFSIFYMYIIFPKDHLDVRGTLP